MKRLLWLDVAKGLAILFVVYFHFFTTYFEHGELPPVDWSSFGSAIATLPGQAWLTVSGLGFHAVGAFIILSGWALMESTARKAAKGNIAWGEWYFARFIRLYPMYWVAHIVYLVSPFVQRLEEVDHRIILSLLGLRFVDITMNFMYLNAAWWYFSMLIQFVAIFPLHFWVARKLGPAWFLLVAAGLGFFVRYLILIPFPQHGLWLLGGCAICRLPEFALGMTLGTWHAQNSARAEKFFLGGAGLLTGLILYPAALQLYSNGITYIFVDFATGAVCLLVILGIAAIISRLGVVGTLFGLVGAYSYGIFLVHQPYVIYIGLRIREQPLWLFLCITVPVVLALMSAWGITLEKLTNQLVNLLLARRRKAAA